VAVRLARRGFSVFPCREGGKAPVTSDGLKSATTDMERVRAWWEHRPRCNVGVHCGRSRLVVLDLDAPKGARTEHGRESLVRALSRVGVFATFEELRGMTFAVSTPSGGDHLWFRYAGTDVRPSAGTVGPGIDVRALESYVIAYPNGNGVPVAPLPAVLRGMLLPKPPPRRSSSEVPSEHRLAKVLELVEHGQEGCRNGLLFWAACRFAECGQSVAAALDSLVPAARCSGLSAGEAERTVRSAFRSE
jgi:hypothetical protein